jgi:hypothetical protein
MRGHPIVVVVILALGACAPAPDTAPPPNPELLSVAENVCGVMWDWQLDMGGIMNVMSAASRQENDARTRQEYYRTAFSDARNRNGELDRAIGALPPGPFVDRMREDIRNGLFVADRVISEIDAEIEELYAAGANGYHQVVSHIFIGFEKVIDVAKPEIADYANPDLTQAFLSVAQCQHGVKDANDGTPRHVPRS